MSTIAVAKIGMGYQAALQRPACRNCKHGEERRADRMPPYNTAHWYCKKGGFKTTAMATCDEYEAKRAYTIVPPGDHP